MEVLIPDKNIAALAEDHAGAIWAGSYTGGGLYRITGEKVEHFGRSDGLKSSEVYTVFEDDQGDLWSGSAGGLVWLHGGKFHSVDSRQGLPSNQVFAIADDSYGRLWIATFGGIASIDKKNLTEWAEGRRTQLDPTIYRATDEMRFRYRVFPTAARSDDGSPWFAFATSVSEVIPPVPGSPQGDNFPWLIEDVKVDGVSHEHPGRLRIPPGARSLEIAYTAIALTNPESVHFRYRLDGADQAWVNADARRVAFYNNLKPGTYTFTVSASSGAGQWRNAPALVLEQPPYFYQTTWFKIACAAAFLSVLWALYRYRVHQIAREFNARLEERVGERTRLARDLHDTLLQSFQGLMLRLQVVDDLLPPGRAKEQLEQTLERADQAIAEGRSAVHDLRSSTTTTNDLAQALRAAADELEGEGSPTFRLVVEGPPRELHPILRDDVYRIAREALRNAFNHSRAHHIEAEISYGERLLRLRIRDDGRGIPAEVLEGGRSGHYGLNGMRERARQIGASLEIWSGGGRGTEIEFSVGGAIAYGKSPGLPRLRLFRKEGGMK